MKPNLDIKQLLTALFAFNSFEDETWMRSMRAGWSRWTFNSFEDETIGFEVEGLSKVDFQFLWGWNYWFRGRGTIESGLSIPLRMKLNYPSYHMACQTISFQFLWGWNVGTDEQYRKIIDNFFQFLWGWNQPEEYVIIPLGTVHFQFLWGWNMDIPFSSWSRNRAFNSFEDETYCNRFVLIY